MNQEKKNETNSIFRYINNTTSEITNENLREFLKTSMHNTAATTIEECMDKVLKFTEKQNSNTVSVRSIFSIINNLKMEIVPLQKGKKEEVNEMGAQIENLNELTTQNENLTTEINKLKSQNAALQKQLSETNTNNETLTKKNTDLQNNNEALQGKLSKAKSSNNPNKSIKRSKKQQRNPNKNKLRSNN